MRGPIPYELLLQQLGDDKNVLASIKYLESIPFVTLTDNEDGEYDPEIMKISVADDIMKRDYKDADLTNLQKKIMDLLVGESLSFFMLQNTQSGKLRASAKEMKKWSEHKEYKVITFFITSNDKTLTDQSAEGLITGLSCGKCDACKKKKMCETLDMNVLSSNNRIDIESVKSKILLYESDPFGQKMPVITSLANKKQNARVLELIDYVCQLAGVGKKIRYGVIFDEADATYPVLREQVESFLDKRTKTLRDISLASLFTSKRFLHRVGWVTATEGDLVDNEDYPECAEAELYDVEVDPISVERYRAIHTRDAILHPVDHPRGVKNNEYAIKLIKDNPGHFLSPHRKIIINSNPKLEDMKHIAKECVALWMNALVFNMNGISIYTPDGPLPSVSTKSKRFNKALFDVVEKLDDRPLVIIGRRKVDRGLSFHYAPADGTPGLIWTDIILCRVEEVSSAVQKAGRMAGVIAHCPQYTGECHYWAPQETLDQCVRKNRVNDKANLRTGDRVKDALEEAYRSVESEEADEKKDEQFELHLKEFSTHEEATSFILSLGAGRPRKPSTNDEGFLLSSASGKKGVLVYETVKKDIDRWSKTSNFGWSGSDGRKQNVAGRLYICYKNVEDSSSVVFIARVVRKRV